MMKDFISILDINKEELNELLADAHDLKRQKKEGTTHLLLPGKTLAMIFEKSSTRTHISFEVGMNELGGHALFLNARDMQIWRGEEIRDTARAASRYVSAMMIRAYKHSTIEEFAKFATIPVINGLSDMEHPCQILADIMTMQEHFGSTQDLKVAWVGDGNNVCHSLILATVLTGLDVTVSTPKGYEPDPGYIRRAQEQGGRVRLVREPEKAVKDAEVIITDTWVSMGDEGERDERLKLFGDYTVDADLMKLASPDARVLHCLPAHRGEEITDEVMEGGQSLIWDEAENRLHAQKALLVRLLKK
ncbi:MAG: ornithine carbamoyltransferase [Methanomicrobiales archaeon]|nr:ornithine carbamoyltransferase [Methanomicrobiales archaeon]